MSQRVLAIGDIHGCAAALEKLIELIEPTPQDTLITLGDCVDRGPDSRRVLELLLELRGECQFVPLLGNHEEMMLNFLDRHPQPDNWVLCGGGATVESYRTAEGPIDIPEEHLDFIRSWGDYFVTDTHFFVHGGYHDQQPFAEQRWNQWRWQSLREFVPGPHVSGRTAVVGHTSQKEGEVLDLGHLICLDTYCYGGGWLTGMDVSTGQIWQVDREGRARPADLSPTG